MEFSELFHAIHRCYGDNEDMVPFFRTLFTYMTEAPDEKASDEKDERKKEREARKTDDPISELKDTNIKNYIRNKPAKKFLRQITRRFDIVSLEDFFRTISDDGANLVVEEFQSSISGINKLNFAEKLSDYVAEMIYQLADQKRPTPSKIAPAQKESGNLKKLYGEYLLAESDNICMFPGCSHPLIEMNAQGDLAKTYEVSRIDSKQDCRIENLVALCPQCHAHHSLNATNADIKELKRIKALKSGRMTIQQGISADILEKNLSQAIKRLSNLKVSETEAINFDPVHVKDKIDASADRLLLQTVSRFVQDNFLDLHKILQDAHRKGDLNVEILRMQIKTLYLKNKGKTQREIFGAIVDKLVQTTKADVLYCQIVVAYFVQSCEIFEAQSMKGDVYATAK